MSDEVEISTCGGLEMGRVESTCEPVSGCGRTFSAAVLRSRGRMWLRQRHCPACAARLEREREDQTAAGRVKARRAQWRARLVDLPKYCQAFDPQAALAGSVELWLRAQSAPAGQRPDAAALERETNAIRRRLERALAAVNRWQPGGKGLGLVGESGRSKTRLLFTLMERLFVAGMRVEFITATDFSNEVGARSKDDIRGAKRWADGLARAAVLFYDDLGKEHLTDRVVKELFNLFDKRAAAGKPIFCTANYTGWQLERRFDSQFPMTGAPIVNRLRDCCEFLAL